MYDKEIKGLQFLLPAIQKVVKSGKKVILHHIGGGEYLEHYIQLSKELGIEANYIPYGQCDKDMVNQIVSEMDFIVSASLMEASGVSVMEAMMLGKPILGTNSGGVDSLVPAFAGKIVEKGSADALADGIVYMLEHFSMFDNKRIETYANENYDKDIISRKYVEIYKNICRKKR
jgi:glycosyltransferase involved in cell wall biosynthesis